MVEQNFYITTAIDYVNGKAHIGHAFEKVITDVIYRHFKQRCDKTMFLTGTDEHGIKIQKTAKSLNITPIELCNQNVEAFQNSWKLLDIGYDKFIRTTSTEHKKIVQKIFEKLLKKGDIYKHSYKGLYCNGCECFLNEKDLTEDGLCPNHLTKPEIVEEENYFFKLTKYKDAIIKHIKSHPDFIIPAFRANEVLNQLENIEDISVSRSINNVNWGIPVLSDNSQIIYVWIDALSNYITALGYDPDQEEQNETFKTFWPATCQVIGKDILKFHSIYWTALLMALDLPLPKHILAHGWITIDETKMSKSLGNVLSPENILKSFELETPDAFRYYISSCANCGKDGNYSDLDFKEKVNADLANNMGNLLNRSLNILVKYFDGEIKNEFIVEDEIVKTAKETVNKVVENFDKYHVAEAAFEIMTLLNTANKYINDKAPWSLAKNGDLTQAGIVLYNVFEVMRYVSVLIYPYCPNIASNIAKQLKTDINIKLCELNNNQIKSGKIISKEEINPVFLRLDSEFAQNKK